MLFSDVRTLLLKGPGNIGAVEGTEFWDLEVKGLKTTTAFQQPWLLTGNLACIF
jgi:hypothetical protein